MFDMGFTELALIGIVALIVIGPERLPGVARTAGKYFGKLRRFMTSVKADVESELRADELRDILKTQQEELQTLKKAVSDVGKDVDNSINDIANSTVETSSDASAEVETLPGSPESWAETLYPPEEAEKPKPRAKSKPKSKPKPKAATKAAKPKVAKPKSAKAKTAKPKVKKVAAK